MTTSRRGKSRRASRVVAYYAIDGCQSQGENRRTYPRYVRCWTSHGQRCTATSRPRKRPH